MLYEIRWDAEDQCWRIWERENLPTPNAQWTCLGWMRFATVEGAEQNIARRREAAAAC
jgi:hypothetical protein